jgi:integrase
VGKIRANEFGSEDVERDLRRRRNGEHRPANATLNRELAIIKRAFRLAAERTPPLVGRVPHILTLKEDNVRTGVLDDEQYRALLHELPDYLQLLFVVGYHTGVRKGELLMVRWAQVDLKGHEIRLRHGETKNDEGRTLPIYGDMLPWIEMADARHQSKCPQCPWVFQKGGQRIKSFRRAWASACTRAGLPGLLFHDLRRSAVRNMERAGIPRKTAMAIAGHKTEAIYWRYAMSNDRDIRDAGRKLERYFEEIRTAADKTITKSITVPGAKSPRPS